LKPKIEAEFPFILKKARPIHFQASYLCTKKSQNLVSFSNYFEKRLLFLYLSARIVANFLTFAKRKSVCFDFAHFHYMSDTQQITEMLAAWSSGDESSIDRLLPMVETELRRIAHNYMRRENPGHTLQTTALVNEAYLKLVKQTDVTWQNRMQFFGISAQIMRRILINHARDKKADKRGKGAPHVNLDDVSILTPEKSNELIALDDALTKLAEFDQTKSRIVELRYFSGLTIEETAEVLGIAPITVSVHWRVAKAWLGKEIRGEKKDI
jgi:RNA polymerase sigma factor (TIGR02999 family)